MAPGLKAANATGGRTAGLPSVLIVDDSAVARAVISRMIDTAGRFSVAGSVANADAALAFLSRTRVDIILLDLEMPGVNGLTALPDLLAAGQGAKILVVSSSCDEGAVATIQALSLGAADTLVKPGFGAVAGRFSDVLTDKLCRLMEHHGEAPVPLSALASGAASRARAAEFDIVAIGASTGGIHALSQLLRAIPPSFQLPILVTQHLPPSFMSYFAAQLSVLASRPCDVATDRMRIRPGRIVVAPGDAHMRLVRMSDGAAIRLAHDPASSGCMPSVDPMFESVADVYGARALGVVLSGMGRDGSEGAKRLAAAGADILVQDRETSVVWGMPGATAAAGVATATLPPAEIGRVIASQRRTH